MLKRWNFLKTGFYEGIKVGGGAVRVGGRVPWGADVEYAFRAGYDGRGRVSVTPVVEMGYFSMLTQPELG